jgi:hypothetical protein
MPTVHACADSGIPQVGPHWTTTLLSEVAKAAGACGALGKEGKGYTEPFRVGTMGEGKHFRTLLRLSGQLQQAGAMG